MMYQIILVVSFIRNIETRILDNHINRREVIVNKTNQLIISSRSLQVRTI